MLQDTAALVKERLAIADVVAPYVKLRRAGKSLVGLCPFHKEKTPSFHVSPERGSYHCFGCGVGGDVFSFMEKVEGIDFKGALKILAEKAGVPLAYAHGSLDTNKRDRLRDALARAAAWYAGQLSHESAAYAYAHGRGLVEDTIREWGLGYAPEGWRALLEALSDAGFTVEELIAAGLIKEADGKPGTYYDRFRNRLIFPIRDSAGRVVAFTGRTLSSEEPAKYLNSPETELYRKSDVLFGLVHAKEAIRTRDFTMLVEGQMDVLHAHQAGFTNTVALSGTALSERHLALLKRYSQNVMLVLDADAAGLSATAKSAVLALSHGLRVKAALLPAGKDPADLMSGSEKGFANCIKEAKPIVEFFLAALAERERDPHRLVRASENVILPLIAAIGSPMEREHFIQIAARSLGLSPESVRESVARLPKGSTDVIPSTVVTAQSVSARDTRENLLLAAAAAYPQTSLAQRIASEYARITGASGLSQQAFPESLLFQAEEMFGEMPAAEAADELLRAFEEAVIREAYNEAVTNLRRAEAAGDATAIAHTEIQCAALSARLAAFGR